MYESHSDVLDLATDLAQRERDCVVRSIRSNLKPIETSKVCLECGKQTLNGARWCNSICRDEWQNLNDKQR